MLEGHDVINFNGKNVAVTTAHADKLAFGRNDFVIASVLSWTPVGNATFPCFAWLKASTNQMLEAA